MDGSQGFIFVIGLICQFGGMIASDKNYEPNLLKERSDNNARVIADIKKKHGTVDIMLPSGERLLHLMVLHNKLNFVGRMLFEGADANIIDKHDKTAYDYASTEKMKKILIGACNLREAIEFCYNPSTGKNDLCMTDEEAASYSHLVNSKK